ncbi:hypothetical protein PQR75_40810 [Paraburkholderia fungorum]|uniref:hypothetical protein n=1 Tax=Paraburkholderia fungorum TaxID=134537 RepID=UPI0038BAA589
MKKRFIFGVLAAAALAVTATASAAGDMTAINLQILNSKGYQTFSQTVVTKGIATFGEQYGYPVAIVTADGTKPKPDLFNGSWSLEVKQVSYRPDGKAVIEADLIDKPASIEGRPASTQHVAVTVSPGASSGTVHGANGDDYVLSVHRLSDADS